MINTILKCKTFHPVRSRFLYLTHRMEFKQIPAVKCVSSNNSFIIPAKKVGSNNLGTKEQGNDHFLSYCEHNKTTSA